MNGGRLTRRRAARPFEFRQHSLRPIDLKLTHRPDDDKLIGEEF